MKFAWIQTEKASYPLTKLCRWLGVTPSGFYAWRQRPESTHAREDRRLKVLVQASFAESKQRYGSPRIHADLIEQDEQVSRKRVIRLMQENGLKARTRKRFTLTTMSDHDQPVAANLLDRQFEAAAPNQRWVGDTTEFVIGSSGKLYLAVVLDLFSRFVVGWAVSAVNDRHLTIKALEMALKRRCPEIGLLHHSDQGCTYASADYQVLLDARGIVCSMSRRGNCYDNAVMESFFSTVKSELADRFDTYGDAKMELFDYIEVFYNQRRRHSTLGQISPAAFERRANEEGVDPMENRQGRGFPQAPHPLSFSRRCAAPPHRTPLDTSLLCSTERRRHARWTTRAVWFSAARRQLHTAALWSIFAPPFSGVVFEDEPLAPRAPQPRPRRAGDWLRPRLTLP